jgi:methylated-DNA-protein-cysteine methyltransferase-like protein|tara:strand:+ start:89 stop:430 length:342 start_codon:yes stop_codon:yes gene_type:complete
MIKNNFFDKVYFVVKQIPFGRVSTYGSIARYIGSPGSSRMVGWAMNASHSRENIPAHRVVNRYGFLTGKHHFQGTNLMEDLLQSEGIKIINNQILNFDIFFWDPSINLKPFKI